MTTIAHDSSGNGLNGTYLPIDITAPPVAAPGLVSGDAALRSGTATGLPRQAVTIPATLAWANPFSVAWWESNTAAWNGVTVIPYLTIVSGPGPDGDIKISNEVGLGFGMADDQFNSWGTTGTGYFPTDGLPHFGVITYSGGTSGTTTMYYDGASVPSTSFSIGPAFNADPFTDAFIGGEGLVPEICDEVATFMSELSAGDVATMYAAALASFAAWTAAVLARSPASFYHLDEGVSPGWHVGVIGMSV